MQTVRIDNNIVVEIIPQYALPVAKWYGGEFAAKCIEVPDDVGLGMVYDPQSKAFRKPVTPEPQLDPVAQIQLAIAELAEAAAQNNLNNKLAIAELAEIVAGGKTNG